MHSLHPTLKLLKWDYGSLDEHQEKDYIDAKMEIINKDMSETEVWLTVSYYLSSYYSSTDQNVVNP